jgi:hypothetical protein
MDSQAIFSACCLAADRTFLHGLTLVLSNFSHSTFCWSSITTNRPLIKRGIMVA